MFDSTPIVTIRQLHVSKLKLILVSDMSNSTVPINEWPMQRIAAGIFVTIWGMVR